MVLLNVKIYVEQEREMTAEDGGDGETETSSAAGCLFCTHLPPNISTCVVFLIRMQMLSHFKGILRPEIKNACFPSYL